MSFDVGTLVGYLKLDTSDVGKSVRAAQSEIRTGLTSMDRDADKAGQRVATSFGGSLSKGLKQFAGGMAALFAVDRIIEWFRGAIDSASDYNETLNRSSVIFGRNEAAMEAWASSAVRSLGMSKRSALDSAASFGDMFAQLGFADDKAAAMSRTVVQMAADFGSFNNLGTDDVLERIAAGFRGEYDSLQKLIPNISAARVEQEALAATGKKSATQLTAQEKAAATLAIVQKDGARAMGDFARTADSAANVQKQTAAAAEELAVKVGNMLLPAYTALVRFGRDQVIPFLSGTVDAIGDAGAAVAPLVSGIVDLVGAFRDLPGPLQGAIIGMLSFVVLGDRMASFGAAVRTHAVDTVRAAQSELDTLRLRAMYAGDAARNAGGGFRGMAGAIGATAGAGLRGAASGLLGVLGGPWGLAFTGAVALIGGFAQAQSNARRDVDAFSDTIDRQTGTMTKASREWISNKFLENFDPGDWQRIADQTGMSLSEIVDGLTATGAAADAFDERWNDLLGRMKAGEFGADTANKAKALSNTFNNISDTVDGARLKFEVMSPAVDAFSDSIAGAGKSAKIAATDFETMADRLERLRNQALDARSASRDYEQAVDDLADAIKNNGKTLDTNTAKGRDNQAALDNLAVKAIALTKANLEQGASIDQVNGQMDTARTKFIEQATRLGMSTTAAAGLADQLGLTKTTVSNLADEISKANTKTVKVTVDRAYLNGQIADIQAQLNSLSGVATITARLQATQAKNDLKLLQNGINPNLQANGSILHNSVRAMASGDVTRQAMLFRQTAPILWNEAPGGESYIPHAPSKRARALAIWQRTGEILGANQGGQGTSLVGVEISGTLDTPWGPSQIRATVRDEIGQQVRDQGFGRA